MGLSDFLKRRRPQDDFARRIMARLSERGWAHEMTYDPRRFEIALGGEQGTMHLHNSYRDWLTYPKAERDGALDLAIAHVLEEKRDLPLEEARDLLLPLVRNRRGMELLHRRGVGSQPASTPLGGPLAAYLAIDRPHSISIVHDEVVERWGIPLESLMQMAVENLESRSPCRFERDDSGFFISNFGDYYDASRLLIPRLFGQLDLPGDPVAVAISRACLVVAGSRDTAGLLGMARFVDAAMEDETRPIAYAPVIYGDGAWSPFEPDGPELAEVRTLSVKQRLFDYANQLEALNETLSPRDVYVAAAEGQFRGSELETRSTWTQGVPTLLPRTDYLGITDLKLHLFRRWADVELVCGPFQVEAGHDPARYFVDRWPDEQQLRRLKAEFSPPPWGPD